MNTRLSSKKVNDPGRQSEYVLTAVEKPCEKIRSRSGMKRRIIYLARRSGFTLFVHPMFGYDELTVRTRIKHARRYGHTPTTRFLVVSRRFVRNLYRIYRRWPELGELFLNAALCHESSHLHQDFALNRDLDERETRANRFMIENMGRPGLVVSLWYHSLHRDAAPWTDSVFKRKRLSMDQLKEKISQSIEMIYRDTIEPDQYDEIIDDVLSLEFEYQYRQKR